MIAIERLVAKVTDQDNWQVIPAHAASWDLLPKAPPDDLADFARLCGAIRTPAGLVIAQRVRHAQRAILGEEHPEDRSFHWYVIAEDDTTSTAERTVIALYPTRLGRCYDAFWDRFAVAGSMPVIAMSFTDLLTRVIDAEGAPYWSSETLQLGDAYD